MTDSTRLIVNADDYGRTPGVTRGIREAHKRGIVTSTTALMNMPGIEPALRQAMDETPRLGLGVHLVLTSGAPLLPPDAVPTLVDASGRFPSMTERLARLEEIQPVHLRAEWDAQIRRFQAVTGQPPDHLDSHHHASYWSEALFEVFLELAETYSCAVRLPAHSPDWEEIHLPESVVPAAREFLPRLLATHSVPHPDYFLDSFYDETALEENLVKLIEALPAGTSELMCHPGYADTELLTGSAYNRPRERELAALTSRRVAELVRRRGISLIPFYALGAAGMGKLRGSFAVYNQTSASHHIHPSEVAPAGEQKTAAQDAPPDDFSGDNGAK